MVIRYDLPKKSVVALRIYDVGGRQLRNLVEGEQVAGRYRLPWDGQDQAGGRLPQASTSII